MLSTYIVLALLTYTGKQLSIGLILLFMFFIIQKVKEKDTLVFDIKLIMAWIPFIILLVGLLFSPNIERGISAVERGLALLIFPVFFAFKNPIYDKKDISNIFLFFIGVLHVEVLYFLVRAILNVEGHTYPFGYAHFTPQAVHPVYFSIYIITTFFYSFFKIMDSKEVKSVLVRRVHQVNLFTAPFMLLIIAARTPLAIFVGLCLTGIFLYQKMSVSKKVKLLALTISLAIFSYFLIPGVQLWKLRFTQYLKPALETRIGLWRASLSAVEDNLWTGVGTGEAKTVLSINVDPAYASPTSGNAMKLLDPHSQYIQVVLAQGIWGILLFALFISFLFIKAWQSNNKTYLLFLLLFWGCGLTEVVLSSQKGIIFFAFFNSLFLFQWRNSGDIKFNINKNNEEAYYF